MSSGIYHTLFTTNDNSLWGIGNNTNSQLGLGHFNKVLGLNKISTFHHSKITQLSTFSYHNLILFENSTVFGFGRNNMGQLGLGHYNTISSPTKIPLQTSQNIKSIHTSFESSIILLNTSKIIAAGSNHNYQIGLKHNLKYNKFISVKYLHNIKTLHCTDLCTFVITHDNKLYVMGNLEYLQLYKTHTLSQNIVKICDLNSFQFIGNGYPHIQWSSYTHHLFPLSFRKSIKMFYNCLYQLKFSTGIKIPKYILYIIIKKSL